MAQRGKVVIDVNFRASVSKRFVVKLLSINNDDGIGKPILTHYREVPDELYYVFCGYGGDSFSFNPFSEIIHRYNHKYYSASSLRQRFDNIYPPLCKWPW
jgi:hypothetical protein